jgi:hypothetical protein
MMLARAPGGQLWKVHLQHTEESSPTKPGVAASTMKRIAPRLAMG